MSTSARCSFIISARALKLRAHITVSACIPNYHSAEAKPKGQGGANVKGLQYLQGVRGTTHKPYFSTAQTCALLYLDNISL
jgi:hypothetical protein